MAIEGDLGVLPLNRQIDDSHKDIYFETIKGTAIGTILAAGMGSIRTIVAKSLKTKSISFPSSNEFNDILTGSTTVAASAILGYLGFRDAVEHNRLHSPEVFQDQISQPESFVSRINDERRSADEHDPSPDAQKLV
jgi:hypothetical protein